jgi:hypothetical protein
MSKPPEPPLRSVIQAFLQIPEVKAGLSRAAKVIIGLALLVALVVCPPWPDWVKGFGILVTAIPMAFVLYKCDRMLSKTRKTLKEKNSKR